MKDLKQPVKYYEYRAIWEQVKEVWLVPVQTSEDWYIWHYVCNMSYKQISMLDILRDGGQEEGTGQKERKSADNGANKVSICNRTGVSHFGV